MIGAEGRVVFPEHAGIEGANGRSGGQIPVLDDALEVGRDKLLTIGMKGDVVDVALMAFEGADRLAVCDGPETNLMVISAAGELLDIAAHGQGAAPTGVSVDGQRRRRRLGIGRPGDDLAIPVRGEERLAVPGKCECAYPALVGIQRCLLAIGERPALNAAILRAGENELAG